ncbi:MAG TPA: PVC-type heme-binding CxxCH protein [Verrucomicrobiae bacterium]
MKTAFSASLVCLGFASVLLPASAADYTLHTFKKTQLSEHFWSEGATFGDINKDGQNDIISGPFWWAGPDFKQKFEYYPATLKFKTKKPDGTEVEYPGFEGGLGTKNTYSDNFFAYTYDFNKDGWTDILIYGFPGKDASWFENPGKDGFGKHWKRHVVFDVVNNESPTWEDIDGDGQPEIVCNSTVMQDGQAANYFGYVKIAANPTEKWKFYPITPKGNWQKFTHGLGVGDVNGDGRKDILEKDGWWEQPASLADGAPWKQHKTMFNVGGSQMFAYDVNGDGRNDVVTALAAHGFGLVWYEQLAEKNEVGEPKFKQHVIMNKEPQENRYGVKFSQLHAMELIDMDGDGLKDIVTGKRFWAHGATGDAEAGAPAVSYWFKLVRKADKSIAWVPHLIDDNSGVGTQVVVGDVNKDKLPDLVVGNKKGTFVLLQESKKVSKAEWEKAQPKVLHEVKDGGLAPDKVVPRTGVTPAPKQAEVKPNPNPAPNGILPVGKDGKALNLDFEKGDLSDWTAKGDAFNKQPMQGDVVNARRNDFISNHAGKYWVGTYEVTRDPGTGTLTSAPFKVTHPWAAFLVAAAPYENTRVDLVDVVTGKAIFTSAGFDGAAFQKSNNATEKMTPVLIDLQPHQGKEIFIRLTDEHQGHWGHINFDDFKFYASKPDFGTANTAARKPVGAGAPMATATPPAPIDDVKFSGLSPEAAAKEMTLPKGFKAHLFAGEPDVKQPVAFCLDDRGRLWVVENYDYPKRKPDGQGTDRILVFEDTNGDHKFDKRTVFIENLNFVTGIEYGFGGVYVGAAPHLMFIPVQESDEPKPAGKPQILLEGWAYQDTHETLNSFTWGPDGWLYGCHGVFTHSHVKKPGDPESTRQFINAGIWRYHPTKHKFELFAEGTSNPWGLDFNEYGHAFIEACVIPHFWHIIQGGRYQRQAGAHNPASVAEMKRIVPDYFAQDFSKGALRPQHPYIFDDIKTHGDHVHYVGNTPHSGNNRSDSAGGGHAHSGLMCYLGGSWPAEYHGKVFMNNIHGQRINVDNPTRTGSGYVGKHSPDFANFNDRWSQIINLKYDQDGSVYMIDWYDKQQCHRGEPEVHDRSNGRVFKVVYNDQKVNRVDLAKASDIELAKYQTHPNEWYARTAKRLLQERSAKKALAKDAVAELRKTVLEGKESHHKLRALWTLHATGNLDSSLSETLLTKGDDYARAWTIQLLGENELVSDKFLKLFKDMAQKDSSAMVRLYLASAIQRIPAIQRAEILEGLLSHAEDAKDHNLPLMYWYATEPVVAEQPALAINLISKSKIPVVREYIARRLTMDNKTVAAAK